MYSDAPDNKSGEPKEEKGDEATAVLSKSVLGGKEFKPGEEVVLEIVEVRDQDVVVKYASEEGGEKEEAEHAEKPAEPAGPDASMTSMME